MIGVFGISEMLVQISNSQEGLERIKLKAIKLPSRADYIKVWKTIMRSTGIGTFIGILPAEGATVASMIGYNEAKRWSKTPEEFGKGAIEGIAGSEAANNSATGGAMVPTLALGIPGSPTAAVILAGLMVHGLRPGPTMFTEQSNFAFSIFWSMMFVNLLFLGVGLYGAKIFARVTLVPVQILWPCVFIFSVVGAYALDQSMMDVWVALGSGVLGYFMRRYGFSVGSPGHRSDPWRNPGTKVWSVDGHAQGTMVAATYKTSNPLFPGFDFPGTFWQTDMESHQAIKDIGCKQWSRLLKSERGFGIGLDPQFRQKPTFALPQRMPCLQVKIQWQAFGFINGLPAKWLQTMA